MPARPSATAPYAPNAATFAPNAATFAPTGASGSAPTSPQMQPKQPSSAAATFAPHAAAAGGVGAAAATFAPNAAGGNAYPSSAAATFAPNAAGGPSAPTAGAPGSANPAAATFAPNAAVGAGVGAATFAPGRAPNSPPMPASTSSSNVPSATFAPNNPGGGVNVYPPSSSVAGTFAPARPAAAGAAGAADASSSANLSNATFAPAGFGGGAGGAGATFAPTFAPSAASGGGSGTVNPFAAFQHDEPAGGGAGGAPAATFAPTNPFGGAGGGGATTLGDFAKLYGEGDTGSETFRPSFRPTVGGAGGASAGGLGPEAGTFAPNFAPTTGTMGTTTTASAMGNMPSEASTFMPTGGVPVFPTFPNRPGVGSGMGGGMKRTERPLPTPPKDHANVGGGPIGVAPVRTFAPNRPIPGIPGTSAAAAAAAGGATAMASASPSSPAAGGKDNTALTTMAKRLAHLKKTNVAQEAALASLRTAIDVAFVMDLTGSMVDWLNQAQNKMTAIMEKAKEMHPEATVRIAFVGYRDFTEGNGESKYDVCDFAPAEQVQRFIKGLDCRDGVDAAEDVLGGIAQLKRLRWKARTRLVVHIADAPAHHQTFHDMGPKEDRYWTGKDPSGLGPEDLDQLLREVCANRGIDYYFFHLTQYTSKMEAVFASILGKYGCELYVLKMSQGPEEFLPKVLASINSSVMRSSLRR
ncbi:hypothetical protein HK102_008777 [Quaeritorhiza haematococci]|nr:hypothetical protein HK102_008777 [Quaeritorhiza haematococci]